jgi:hypothetical protein
MGLHAPELLILYALDMFLVLSIVTVLFDSNFPMAVPYFFQILSIAGTGHMYISRMFDEMFTLDSRYWYSFFYLTTMILSAFAVTAYLLFLKKSVPKGLMFLGGFSFPSACLGIYLITFYKDYPSVPFIFKIVNGNWIGVMILGSFLILVKGAKMFIETDPRFKNLREALMEEETIDLDEVRERTDSRDDEIQEDEPYNPVDHMHVEYDKVMEQDEYDY